MHHCESGQICNVLLNLIKFLFFQSGDDTEELNQDLNGNQNYDNGDLEMEVGFEGELSNCSLLSTSAIIYKLCNISAELVL